MYRIYKCTWYFLLQAKLDLFIIKFDETLSGRRLAAQAVTSEAVVENALKKQAARYDKLSAVRWPTRRLTSNTDRCMCGRASSFLSVLLFLVYVPQKGQPHQCQTVLNVNPRIDRAVAFIPTTAYYFVIPLHPLLDDAYYMSMLYMLN